MRARQFISAGVCTFLAMLLGGCAGTGRSLESNAGAGRWVVKTIGDDKVIFGNPQIAVVGNEFVVTGTLTRTPGYKGEIDGRVAVIFLSTQGEFLNQIILTLDRQEVPAAGSAGYSLQYGWIPPTGSTVVIELAGDRATPLATSSGPVVNPNTVSQSDFTRTPIAPSRSYQTPQNAQPRPGARGSRR